MFRFDESQLSAVAAARRAYIAQRVAAMVRALAPDLEAEQGPEGVTALARHVIAFGAAHDVVTEPGLLRLLALEIERGASAEMTPYRAFVLTRPGEPEAARLDAFAAALDQPDGPALVPDAEIETLMASYPL